MPCNEQQYSKKNAVFTRVGQRFAPYRTVAWLRAVGKRFQGLRQGLNRLFYVCAV